MHIKDDTPQANGYTDSVHTFILWLQGLPGRLMRMDPVLWGAIVLGLLVRAWELGSMPPGMNQDEASTAYDAYSLIRYGVDRNGSHFPVVLISWGSGMYALASYVAMPFIGLLGLSAFAARLPFFLAGVAAIPLFYVLLRDTIDLRTARIGAVLLAISPWHIMVSRWGLDSNMFPFFFLIATVLLVRSLHRPRLLIASGIFYALSVYGYGTAYVAVPVFGLLALGYGLIHKQWTVKTVALSAGAFFIIALPIALFVLINKFQWNAFETPFFTIPRLSGVPRFETMGNTNVLSGAFYASAWENIKNAFNLFMKQDDGLPWNAIDEYGIMYPFTSILAIFGFAILCAQSWKKQFDTSFILLSWCIASMVLTAFVSVNINRANIAMFPFVFCVAVAVAFLWHNRAVATVLTVMFAFSFVGFVHAYFGRYRDEIGSAFFASFGESVQYAASLTDDQICVTGNVNMPYIFVLLYNKEDPRAFYDTVQYENPGAEFQSVSTFGRYTFGLDRCRNNADVIVSTWDELYTFDRSQYEVREFERYAVLHKIPQLITLPTL